MLKLSLTIITLTISTSLFAGNTLCTNLTGTWNGTYNDPTHLFNSGNFPISLQLKYEKNRVYGYTLPVNDSNAGNFGINKGAYFFIATCKNNTLSQVYFIKNQNPSCGDPAQQILPLTNKTTLTKLILPYENAMTGANLSADLIKQTSNTPIDKDTLSQVKATAHGTITTCH